MFHYVFTLICPLRCTASALFQHILAFGYQPVKTLRISKRLLTELGRWRRRRLAKMFTSWTPRIYVHLPLPSSAIIPRTYFRFTSWLFYLRRRGRRRRRGPNPANCASCAPTTDAPGRFWPVFSCLFVCCVYSSVVDHCVGVKVDCV